MTPKQQLLEKIEVSIKNRKEIVSVVGAFGDVENCEGYIEDVSYPPDGGIFIKFFGCDFLFKGWPDNKIVEGIGLAKSFVSTFPRMILAKSLALQIFIIFMYIFQRNKLIHFFNCSTAMIHGHITSKIGFDPHRYNRYVKELKRSFDARIMAWDRIIPSRERESVIGTTYDEKDIKGQVEKRKMVKSIAHLGEFLCLFLEHDTAYKIPLQDIIPLLNKEALLKNPRKEIMRLFDICIERATEHGILGKAKEMKKLLNVLFIISPFSLKFTKEFLYDLDLEKIKPDKYDLYFSYKRRGYSIQGLSLDERLAIKEKLDIEHHHYRMQLMNLQMPNEPVIQGFKVVNFDDRNDILPKKEKKEEKVNQNYIQ